MLGANHNCNVLEKLISLLLYGDPMYPYLFLVLNYILSDINIGILVLFWLGFAWYSFCHPLNFYPIHIFVFEDSFVCASYGLSSYFNTI